MTTNLFWGWQAEEMKLAAQECIDAGEVLGQSANKKNRAVMLTCCQPAPAQ